MSDRLVRTYVGYKLAPAILAFVIFFGALFGGVFVFGLSALLKFLFGGPAQ